MKDITIGITSSIILTIFFGINNGVADDFDKQRKIAQVTYVAITDIKNHGSHEILTLRCSHFYDCLYFCDQCEPRT